MIALPRPVARLCRAVFKRLLPRGKPRGHPAVVGLLQGPQGLLVRCATEDAAVEYHHPTSGEEARLAVPQDALAACEGRDGDAVVRPLVGGRVEVAWHQSGAPQTRTYPTAGLEMPQFPAWPDAEAGNGSGLLAALDRAAQVAAREGTRYALHRVQLGGRRGEVAATDGRQLLVEAGFRFPWADQDLLVPRVALFGAPELAAGGPVRVGLSGGHVLLRVGCWTVAMKVAQGERFPDVHAVIPLPRPGGTTWRLGPGEGEALARALPGLPGADEDLAPVTVDLGRGVVVRARAEGQGRPTEVALPQSQVQGKPVRFATNRQYLARACQLGFDSFAVLGPDRCMVCRQGTRTFLWMTLAAKDALPPHPFPLRVLLAGSPHPTSASGIAGRFPPAGATPRAHSAAMRDQAGRGEGGWPGLLSLWPRLVSRLAGLVRDQRRRERDDGV